MMTDPRSYLTSDRGLELRECLSNDIDRGHTDFLVSGSHNEVDFHLSVLGLMDVLLEDAIGYWRLGEKTPRPFRKYARKLFEQGAVVELADKSFADFAIDNFGYEPVLDYLADLSMERTTSDNIASYHPQNIENWIRRGLGYSAFPLFKDLFSRKNRPESRPSASLTDEVIVRLACVSEMLRDVRSRALERHNFTVGKRSYIKSLDGLLFEYDVYLNILERLIDGNGVSRWALPSPPNIDYGPNNTFVKGDIIWLVFNKSNPADIRATLIDAKIGLGRRRYERRENKPGVIEVTAQTLGCVVLNEGELKLDLGALCDDYIGTRKNIFNNERLETKEGRLALAMSVLHLPISPFVQQVLNTNALETS